MRAGGEVGKTGRRGTRRSQPRIASLELMFRSPARSDRRWNPRGSKSGRVGRRGPRSILVRFQVRTPFTSKDPRRRRICLDNRGELEGRRVLLSSLSAKFEIVQIGIDGQGDARLAVVEYAVQSPSSGFHQTGFPPARRCCRGSDTSPIRPKGPKILPRLIDVSLERAFPSP